MNMQLSVLRCGSCEPLKAGVHATALGIIGVMALYNAAAWLTRRERHLGINAVVYGVLMVWEQQHVAHHLATLKRQHGTRDAEQPTDSATRPAGAMAA
jgi:hypothetical protein